MRDGARRADRLATRSSGSARRSQLEVVAEGIETDEQWTRCSALGCDYGQGYYFARPLDAEASLAHLAAPVP